MGAGSSVDGAKLAIVYSVIGDLQNQGWEQALSGVKREELVALGNIGHDVAAAGVKGISHSHIATLLCLNVRHWKIALEPGLPTCANMVTLLFPALMYDVYMYCDDTVGIVA